MSQENKQKFFTVEDLSTGRPGHAFALLESPRVQFLQLRLQFLISLVLLQGTKRVAIAVSRLANRVTLLNVSFQTLRTEFLDFFVLRIIFSTSRYLPILDIFCVLEIFLSCTTRFWLKRQVLLHQR